MHKVKYSKAEAAIWGCVFWKLPTWIFAHRYYSSIEKIGIYKKKKKQVVDSSKAGIEKVSEKVSEATSKEQEAISKLKREVLHGKPGWCYVYTLYLTCSVSYLYYALLHCPSMFETPTGNADCELVRASILTEMFEKYLLIIIHPFAFIHVYLWEFSPWSNTNTFPCSLTN